MWRIHLLLATHHVSRCSSFPPYFGGTCKRTFYEELSPKQEMCWIDGRMDTRHFRTDKGLFYSFSWNIPADSFRSCGWSLQLKPYLPRDSLRQLVPELSLCLAASDHFPNSYCGWTFLYPHLGSSSSLHRVDTIISWRHQEYLCSFLWQFKTAQCWSANHTLKGNFMSLRSITLCFKKVLKAQIIPRHGVLRTSWHLSYQCMNAK